MLTRTPRIAVLCSRRAPGLLDLARRFPVAVCIASDERFDERFGAESRGVRVLVRDVEEFHHGLGRPLADLDARRKFDAELVETLHAFSPEVVLLDGWLYRITEPMLEAFPGRIFNVHHGDLVHPDPRRRFPGLRAIRNAVLSGETAVRSTLHFVDERIDGGPPVLRSWPVRVPEELAWARDVGDGDGFARGVRAFESQVLGTTFGPLLIAGVRLFGEGRLTLSGSRARIDGAVGPWSLAPAGWLMPPEATLQELRG